MAGIIVNVYALTIIVFFCLFFQPVHAEPKKYQPEVSAPKLVTEKLPYNIIVWTNVTDKFGEINSSTLTYSMTNGTIKKTVPMELSWGDRRNGSYIGIIEFQNRKPIYVNYTLSFIDNLGYVNSTEKSLLTNFTDDKPPIVILSKPDNATQTLLPHSHKKIYVVPTINFDTTIRAQLADRGGGSGIKNVTMFYTTTDFHGNFKNVSMQPVDPMKPGSRWEGKWLGKISNHRISPNSTVSYHIIACDYAGNCSGQNARPTVFNYRLGMSDKNHTDFHVNILEADPLNLTIKTEPSIIEHIDQNLKSDRFEGIGIGKNNHSYSNLRWDSSERPVLQAEMMGNRSNYPFDSYNASIILAIPKTPDNHINERFSSEFTPVAADNWNIFASSKSIGSHLVEKYCPNVEEVYMVCQESPEHDSTFFRINLLFTRNYAIWSIIIPVLTIFFLLGASFIFPPGPSNIGNRLTLTLGIFALMFSLPEIINSLKPAASGPTLADSLISIIVVATISYTVGSVIGSKIIKEGNSEQEEVQPDKLGLWVQKWLDTIVFVVVCSYIVLAFIFYQYPINISLWIGSIIIIGLGYGLLFRLHSVRKLFKFIGSKIKARYKQIEP